MHLIKLLQFSLVLICFLVVNSCSLNDESRIEGDGSELVEFNVIPFDIEDVTLLDGEFKHATELNEDILLAYKPDRFLAGFRKQAGLEPKAKQYEGWESNTIAGHSLGHYLTALCLMYETTGTEEYLKRANYIVDELDTCQQADGGGYIGAFERGKEIFENEVSKGDIRAKGFDLNGLWSPFYTMHKVMQGLNYAYSILGNEKALKVNLKFADWIGSVLANLDVDKLQEMLNCEFGGINETLVDLYGYTADDKYLELSRLFNHHAIIDPITEGKDILAGKHANTQIPKFVGLARRYELTGDLRDSLGAVNFWDMVVHHHSYVTGGNGNNEYLGEPDKLSKQLSDNTTETCNVYNMLKLSEHLFKWNARPEVMDFYERALFNHIRSSQHPHSGHVIYNLSLDMGGFKVYQDPYWFTCCVGSGMETHSKYSKNIYYHNNEDLYVVQFISSELRWREKGLVITQITEYPESEDVSLSFSCNEPVRMNLFVRYPGWATNGIEIKINGKKIKISDTPGSFISINRKWKEGDTLNLHIPFSLRIECMPDNDKRLAVFNGPVVLAGDLGPVPDSNSTDPFYVPVLMTRDRNPANWLIPVEGEFNTFYTSDISFPRKVELKPFYRTYDRHYTIFWDTYTSEEWEVEQLAYEKELKRKKELEFNTIDHFRIGEMQPERNHNFREYKTWVNEFRSKKSREADRGGWFSFEMKADRECGTSLAVEYWGGYSGSKTFDILVEDHIIATENISEKAPGEFIDIIYEIPPVLLTKDRIRVKFVPHDGHRAGPVFTVRTIKPDFKN